MTDNRSRVFTSYPYMKPMPNQPIIKSTSPPPPTTRNPYIDKIHREIVNVDKINKELLIIADKIRGMSPLNTNPTNNMIIDRIENDIRLALNELIQNIMEFFKDIDGKLKNLGFMIDTEFNRKITTPRDNQPVTRLQQTMDAKYQQLSDRIKSLEISLRQTQQNEKKLIQVIENMMEKYQVNDQPTLIRDTPALQNQFRKNRIATSNSNAIKTAQQQNSMSQNIKEMTTVTTTTNLLKPENKKKSLYQNLYTIEQSVVDEGTTPHQFRLRQIEEDPSEQVYIKKLYSKNPPQASQNNFLTESKKSLRGQPMYQSRSIIKPQRSTACQSTTLDDKQHRLNFMMNKLNL